MTWDKALRFELQGKYMSVIKLQLRSVTNICSLGTSSFACLSEEVLPHSEKASVQNYI